MWSADIVVIVTIVSLIIAVIAAMAIGESRYRRVQVLRRDLASAYDGGRRIARQADAEMSELERDMASSDFERDLKERRYEAAMSSVRMEADEAMHVADRALALVNGASSARLSCEWKTALCNMSGEISAQAHAIQANMASLVAEMERAKEIADEEERVKKEAEKAEAGEEASEPASGADGAGGIGGAFASVSANPQAAEEAWKNVWVNGWVTADDTITAMATKQMHIAITPKWDWVSGKRVSGSLVQIAVSNLRACGVDSSGYVYCADDIRTPNWKKIQGRLNQVDISGDVLCGVHAPSGGMLYTGKFNSDEWTLQPVPSGGLKQISISGDGGRNAIAVNQKNEIFCARDILNPQWTRMANGLLSHVSLCGDMVYGVSPGGYLYRGKFMSDVWKPISQSDRPNKNVQVDCSRSRYAVMKDDGVAYINPHPDT